MYWVYPLGQGHYNHCSKIISHFFLDYINSVLFISLPQESRVFKKYHNIYSNSNIDQYNAFLSQYVTGTDIILWDSNIPLSDTYYQQCEHTHRKTYDMLWNCADPMHSGYVTVEKYVDMLINDVCNPYLDLDARYC